QLCGTGWSRPEAPAPLHPTAENDGRPARRIAGPGERDLLTGAQLRLKRRSPIMHARAFERPEILHGRPPVAYAARDHHRAGARAFAIRESEHERAAAHSARRF